MDSNKRPESMERITTPELAKAFIEEQVEAVREQVGDRRSCWPCPAAWTPLWLPPCSSGQLASSWSAFT